MVDSVMAWTSYGFSPLANRPFKMMFGSLNCD